MATYSLQPIDYTNINSFLPMKAWNVPHNTQTTVYFVLLVVDAAGQRRFIPPAGSLVKLGFIKSRGPTTGSNSQVISKTAIQVAPTEDKSIYKVDLTALDTSILITGGIQLSVTLSGVENLISIPYVVNKIIANPGF